MARCCQLLDEYVDLDFVVGWLLSLISLHATTRAQRYSAADHTADGRVDPQNSTRIQSWVL